MAFSLMILRVRIVPPTPSNSDAVRSALEAPCGPLTGELVPDPWRVEIDGGTVRGEPRSGGLLATCDTEREAKALVAALGLDGLLDRMSEYLRRFQVEDHASPQADEGTS
jgi:hypothetical protein